MYQNKYKFFLTCSSMCKQIILEKENSIISNQNNISASSRKRLHFQTLALCRLSVKRESCIETCRCRCNRLLLELWPANMRANGLTTLKQSLEKRQATKRNKLGARGNERCVSLIATVNHFHFHVFHLLLESQVQKKSSDNTHFYWRQ
ncbi:hypothetical protein T10_5721 [Trichinella papuae]|uniref:Uncharacterized protein n=1 Tax=Trichinella papuae TaxID=268474 RepID=A0A0V1MUH3_9BILA|nr:hypothetical protein T10_5721 [Trichinella papuae]